MKKFDLAKLRPEKHPYYFLFKEKGIPICAVAAFIDIKPNYLSQILNGHANCPSYIEKRLDKLVHLHFSDWRPNESAE